MAAISASLNAHLPPGSFAEPNVQYGVEIDKVVPDTVEVDLVYLHAGDGRAVLGLPHGQIYLVPYTPEWKRLFEEEKARLLTAVGDHVLDIQHVGSTSIPGMAAKPIIDIAMAVDDFERASVCVEPIEGLGYSYRGENGIPRRHFFTRGDPRTYNIHMVEIHSAEWQRMLSFRDYLSEHPDLAAEYLALKQSLAQRFSGDIEAYTNGKTELIERVLRLALARE